MLENTLGTKKKLTKEGVVQYIKRVSDVGIALCRRQVIDGKLFHPNP